MELDRVIDLEVTLKAENVKKDDKGNIIFEVEASNENLDLQNQIVLQQALLDSKDYFLSNGVISADHGHTVNALNGVKDESFIIGEPLDVKTCGNKTIVTGKLYATVPRAQDFIRLLEADSTRVKASVGGSMAEVKEDASGKGVITRVLWDDLALTTQPVNSTVGAATIRKALSSAEFVKALKAQSTKALSAQSDSGQALTKEDVGEKDVADTDVLEALGDLRNAIERGDVEEGEAAAYLKGRGVKDSEMVIGELLAQGGKMKKESAVQKATRSLDAILKTLRGKKCKDCEDVQKGKEEDVQKGKDAEDEDVDFEEDDADADEAAEPTSEELEAEAEAGGKRKVAKSVDAEEAYYNAESAFGKLVDKVDSMQAAMEVLQKAVNVQGEMMAKLSEVQIAMSQEKLPARSVVAKSVEVPKVEDFYKVQELLVKATRSGRLDIMQAGKISSSVQKAIALGKPLSAECQRFIESESKEER